MTTLHSRRCGAYLSILADPIPGEKLADVDQRTSDAVRDGALTCTCYRADEAESSRHRGVVAYVMPERVCGPIDRYALVVRDLDGEVTARMVHTEGVAYLVTNEKPWRWNDYEPGAPVWTLTQLISEATEDRAVDLADWVRTFGARLESNFGQVYGWAVESDSTRRAL